MQQDVINFCKGCILCQIYKSSTVGPNEIGTPRPVTEPRKFWQMDICSGLVGVKNSKSFLNLIDLYTGFSIAVPLKSETSSEIANILENQLIKIFGVPEEISSDNAANLQGPEIKKLLAFYGIRQRNTVPYSPTSHSLVEISNRYIVQLLRIFSDQFQSQWPNVLTLANLIYNSVPRPQLSNHSPHYLMFLNEPFANEYYFKDKNLSLATYVKDSLNDRMFLKLIRERLLKIRESRNKAKNFKYVSYPVNSMILVKDLRPKIHKKLKPLFYKTPFKVVSEYKNTVFAKDFLGKIHKVSKNNIKMAHPRTVELFANLPDEIKLILGEEFDLYTWEKIQKEEKIPKYLADLEIEDEIGRQLRSGTIIPLKSHTVPMPELQDDSNEVEFLEEILEDSGLNLIKDLHENGQLVDQSLTLQDLPRLRKNLEDESFRGDLNQDVQEAELPNSPQEEETTAPRRRRREVDELDLASILPERFRRRKRVRFQLP
jgi:hypothetical protein